MKQQGLAVGTDGGASLWGGWIAFSGTSSADMEHPEAGEGGRRGVKDCTTCHVDKLSEERRVPHEFNDAGKWLVAEKDKRKAAKVDGAWLKDYPGKK